MALLHDRSGWRGGDAGAWTALVLGAALLAGGCTASTVGTGAPVVPPAGPSVTADDLAKVAIPTLVVIGDRDPAGPGEPLADALPDARLVTLPGVDHFSTPKSFGAIDAALEFLGAAP